MKKHVYRILAFLKKEKEPRATFPPPSFFGLEKVSFLERCPQPSLYKSTLCSVCAP